MAIKLAFRAFFKALKDRKAAEEFLSGSQERPCQEEAPHLRLLALLQNSGRLIDFFKEDITSYSDAQVGVAVRKIHADCAKALEEMVTLRPLLDEAEGDSITLQKGYDPTQFQVMGHVKGEAPYKGKILHRGWKAHKISLPKSQINTSKEVICPAQIEV